MTHAELRELLPAYALDALEAGEVSLVETHLSACAECRRDLREFQEVAAHLAHAEELREPPTYLRQRVLERVAAMAGPPGLTPTRARRWTLPRLSWRWTAATAAALIVAALGGWAAFLQVQVRQVQEQNQQLVAALRDQRVLTYMLASPNIRVVALESIARQDPQPGGMLLGSLDHGGTLFVGFGLKPLPPDQVYKLWLVRPEERLDAGNLKVDKDGYSQMWLQLRRPIADYIVAGVTVESTWLAPDAAPTGSLLLRGALQPGQIR